MIKTSGLPWNISNTTTVIIISQYLLTNIFTMLSSYRDSKKVTFGNQIKRWQLNSYVCIGCWGLTLQHCLSLPARASEQGNVIGFVFIHSHVGLARIVSPTNTNFLLTFFTNPTSGGSLWRLTHMEHQTWSLPSLFWPLFHSGSQFVAPVKNCLIEIYS